MPTAPITGTLFATKAIYPWPDLSGNIPRDPDICSAPDGTIYVVATMSVDPNTYLASYDPSSGLLTHLANLGAIGKCVIEMSDDANAIIVMTQETISNVSSVDVSTGTETSLGPLTFPFPISELRYDSADDVYLWFTAARECGTLSLSPLAVTESINTINWSFSGGASTDYLYLAEKRGGINDSAGLLTRMKKDRSHFREFLAGSFDSNSPAPSTVAPTPSYAANYLDIRRVVTHGNSEEVYFSDGNRLWHFSAAEVLTSLVARSGILRLAFSTTAERLAALVGSTIYVYV